MTRTRLILIIGLGGFLTLLVYHSCAVALDLAAVVGLH